MKKLRKILGILILIATAGLTVSANTVEEERPNIILIISDDQGCGDLSPSVLADVKTPHLERLGASGVRFTQAYVSAPICNASRLGIMTGLYQQRLGTYWYASKGIQDSITMAEILKQQGYANGYIGKLHYGATPSPADRDFPLNHGFDYFYGFSGGHKHYLIHNEAKEDAFKEKMKKHDREARTLAMGAMWENREKVDAEGLSTDLFGDKAREFIGRNKDGKFFLQLSFNAVHCFTHQLPESYLKQKGLSGYADWDPAKETMKEWDPAFHTDPAEGRGFVLGQLDFMDRQIGKLLDYLEEQQLRENTMIIFLSDNGGSQSIFSNNGPLRGGKYTLFEGGVRVPMLVSWPRAVPQGQVLDNVVSSLDIFPTLATVAGAKTLPNLDGMDITSLLTGENRELQHEALFWDTGKGFAVRRGDWKLRSGYKSDDWTFSKLIDSEPGAYLFNLKDDIGETTNLKDAHPEKFSQLRTLFDEWKSGL